MSVLQESPPNIPGPPENYATPANLMSKMVVPPPLSRQTEEIDNLTHVTDPGEIVLSMSGKLLRQYLTYEGFTADLIEGYDNMLLNTFPERIKQDVIPFKPNTEIAFTRVQYIPPKTALSTGSSNMTPLMARDMDATYSAEIQITVQERDRTTKAIVAEKIFSFGKIPVMLGSSLCHLRIGKTTDQEKLQIGECPSDPLGSFIIRGTEYFLYLQDELRRNRILILPAQKGTTYARFLGDDFTRGSSMVILQQDEYAQMINIYLNIFGVNYGATSTNKKKGRYINVMVIYRILGKPKPEDIVDRILFFVRPDLRRKASYLLVGNTINLAQIGDDYEYLKKELDLALKHKPADVDANTYIYETIREQLFINIESEDIDRKLMMLSVMVAQYIEHLLGYRNLDDQDSWSVKYLKTPGLHMEALLLKYWKITMENLKEDINKSKTLRLDILRASFKPNDFTTKFEAAFTKHDWNVGKGPKDKRNLSEVLKRDSILQLYSQMNTISSPTDKQTSKIEIRIVNFSQLGYVCPIETPEGEKIGLTRHRSITCWISIYRDENILYPHWEKLVTDQYDLTINNTMFLINGKFIGWCYVSIKDVSDKNLYRHLLSLRRNLTLPKDIAIVYDRFTNSLNIHTEGGRPTRPLLIVEDGELVLAKKNLFGADFPTLLREGVVEYVDAWEQEFIQLAPTIYDVRGYKYELAQAEQNLTQAESYLDSLQTSDTVTLRFAERNVTQARNIVDRINRQEQIRQERQHKLKVRPPTDYTHCEIDPNAMMGVAASIIPLTDHNPAPRNQIACKHASQALGIYHSNYRTRFDKTVKMLAYPQRPIFETQMNEMIGLNELPAGQMVTLAIMPYLGYNQEDAIIVNQASIDRGLFMYVVYSTVSSIQRYESQRTNKGYFNDIFKLPPPDIRRRNAPMGAYDNLDENGFPRLGSEIKEGYAIIGKIRTSVINGVEKKEDASIYALSDHIGIVDRIYYGPVDSGQVLKVKIRKVRKPMVGDKLASRSAQKSTIGLILPQEDMPFMARDGTPIDCIINPLAIPSRMTIGKIFEMAASKLGALRGERINATSFNSFDLNGLVHMLKQYGYGDYGNEIIISGLTGEQMEGSIYVGPCYYQALRHHAADKIQMRAIGAVKADTRQPVHSRAKHGGTKLGNMEVDALTSHGASAVMFERLLLSSDAYNVVFCTTCGNIPIANLSTQHYTCRLCGDEAEFGRYAIPYPFKLFQHYMAGSGIKNILRFKKQAPDQRSLNRTSI